MTTRLMNTTALLGSVALSLCANAVIAAPVYTEGGVIPVPPIAAVNPGSSFSFDISFFDGTTQLDYVADRSNAAIDVFSSMTNSFVKHITGTAANAFVGANPVAPVVDSGPNGVLVVNGVAYGGDGDASVKAFNVVTNAPVAGSPITLGAPAQGRADEMAFDPANHILVVASDHGTPSPYISLIDTTTNSVVKQIIFNGAGTTPNATNGIEQPAWNPATGKFYISVPEIGGSPNPGGIAVVDPVTQTVTKFFDLSTFGIASCGPTGLALGVGNQMMIGCGSGGSILFDPTANAGAGKVIATFAQATGIDELAFDPSNDLFFLASSAHGLSIINGLTDTFLQQLATGPGAHSVSVDPVSNEVFVPVRANANIAGCATGCVLVFTTPEPTTLPLFGAGLLGLAALAWRKRRKLPAHAAGIARPSS